MFFHPFLWLSPGLDFHKYIFYHLHKKTDSSHFDLGFHIFIPTNKLHWTSAKKKYVSSFHQTEKDYSALRDVCSPREPAEDWRCFGFNQPVSSSAVTRASLSRPRAMRFSRVALLFYIFTFLNFYIFFNQPVSSAVTRASLSRLPPRVPCAFLGSLCFFTCIRVFIFLPPIIMYIWLILNIHIFFVKRSGRGLPLVSAEPPMQPSAMQNAMQCNAMQSSAMQNAMQSNLLHTHLVFVAKMHCNVHPSIFYVYMCHILYVYIIHFD